METTYAAKIFDGIDNSDIDFITNPAHFMVGSLTSGSELAFGTNTLAEGTGGCYEFVIEAPQSVLDTIRYMEGFQVDDTTVHRVERTQEQINSSIDDLLSNARTYASTFNTRAESPDYAFPSACIYDDPNDIRTNSYILLNQGNMTINLTDDYADRVVYINVDATMLLAIAKNDGVSITKPDSTVVVFNFPDGISLPDDSRKYGCEIFINEIIVNGVHSKTGAKGHSSEFNSFTEVDSTVCRSIIWNVPGTRTVCLGDMGGVLNAPNSAVQSREGSTNGWIIADTMDVYVEHHFIYQDTSSASMSEFSFYIVKALTRQYGYNDEYSGDASHSVVVPDTSIHVGPNQFAFIWQEYTDDTYQTTVGDSTTAPVGSVSTVPANAYFPHITFFSDEGHTSDAHYVAPGTTGSFYFRVTEDPNTGVEGISNSAGYVDIRLDVTAVNDGTFTYAVDYTFWTGDSNDLFIYNAQYVDNVRGNEFRIGSFYNRVDYDVEYGSLKIGKIVTLDGSDYQPSSHPFGGVGPGFTFTVTREINGITYYYDKDGNRSTSPLYVTISGDDINYYYNGQGNVTISNLPIGTYTITEVVDSSVSQVTAGGTTYYLDTTDYDVAGASTQTVTVTTNNQSDISITNDYTTTPQYTGSLVITKLITLPAGGSLSDLDNIEFTISPAINGVSTLTLDPDNIAGTGWTYDDATGVFTYTFDSLVQGTEYTVTETADGTNATNNYDVVVVTPAPVTIPTDTTQDTSVTADVTNTYSEGQTQYGSLTVEKVQATGSDTIPAGASFEVTVTFSQAVNYAVNGGTPITTATNTYTTNLAVDGSVTLSNIPVGVTYTVAETAPGTDYGTPTYTNGTGSITTAGITATVANTYTAPTQTGGLTIEKVQATGSDTIPAGASFEVTVTFSQAVNYAVNGGTPITTASDTYTTNLAVGDRVNLSNIPVGVTYTVAETAPGTGYGTPTYTNGTGSITAAGITATVANTYTAPTQYGSLTVEKIQAAGSDTIPAGASFEVTVTFSQAVNYAVNGGTPITTATNTYTTNLAVDGSVTLSNIPVGVTYTVAETAPGAGYGTPTYTNETGSITAAGITATVANTYTAPAVTGSLKINKTVDGLGSDTLDAVTNFEFTVTWVDTSVTPNVTYYYYLNNGTTDVSTVEHTVVVRIAAGQVSGSVQLDGLIAGRAYTVTEVSGRIPASVVAGGNSYDYQSTTGEGSVNVTAANIPTNPVTADVVNTYSASQPQPSTCNIDIDKTTVGGVEVAGATITLTNTNGTDLSGCTVGGGAQSSSISGNVITFVSGSNGVTTIVGLPDGDYVLEETIVPTVSGGTYTVATTIGFTINSGSVVDSSVTGITDGNGYQPSTGTANAVFVLFDNFTADPTQTTPSETTPSDTNPTETTPTETTPTETSSEDTQPAVPQYGCLVISKTISGTSLNELETITFVLTDTSCGATRDVPALTLANVQSGLWGDAGNGTYYYIVEGLSAGVTYTVTESLDGHTSTYTLDAVNSITTGSAMIVANGTVYVTLTDAYVAGDGTTPTESSSSDESNPSDETSETTAPEVSSVTLDGQPLSPDSYTVNPDGTITLNDAVIRSLGSGDHTIVITYVNGATRTQTVHVDGADRDVAETGETSVNAIAAVVMLSAMVLIYFSKKLRDEAEAEAEN
jgi:hypothetical protein